MDLPSYLRNRGPTRGSANPFAVFQPDVDHALATSKRKKYIALAGENSSDEMSAGIVSMFHRQLSLLSMILSGSNSYSASRFSCGVKKFKDSSVSISMPIHEAMSISQIFCHISDRKLCSGRAAAKAAIESIVPRFKNSEKINEQSTRRRRALGPALSSVLSLLSVARRQANEADESNLKYEELRRVQNEARRADLSGSDEDDDARGEIGDGGDYGENAQERVPLSPPGSRLAIFLAGAANYVCLLLLLPEESSLKNFTIRDRET